VIPFRVRISDVATNRFRFIKSRTGLTPNILCRIALVLSLREKRPVLAEAPDLSGQELNAPTLFGEHQRIYELMLEKYCAEQSDDREMSVVIASHIDNGLHKMGHVRSLNDVAMLT
jgi:DNA sulfur modification protein DndE